MIINGFDSGSIKTAISANWVTLYSKNITIGGNPVNEYDSDYSYFLLDPSTEGFVVPDLSGYRFIRVACNNLSITVGNVSIKNGGSSAASISVSCGFTNISSFYIFSHKYFSPDTTPFWSVQCTLPGRTEAPVGANLADFDYSPVVHYNDLGWTYNSQYLGYPVGNNVKPVGRVAGNTPSEYPPDYNTTYCFWNKTGNSQNDSKYTKGFVYFYYNTYQTPVLQRCICVGDTIYLCMSLSGYETLYSSRERVDNSYQYSNITCSGTFRIEALPY